MWQKKYQQKDFYWGLEPDGGVVEAVKHAIKGEALDIGSGEGRNSIFLAQNGFTVTAIDKIPEGVEKLKNKITEHDLNITPIVGDIKDFKFIPEKYSLIIAVCVIDFLKKDEINNIIKNIKASLIKNGIVFLRVFSVEESVSLIERGFKPMEENTFYMPKMGFYRHFFTSDELREYFSDYEIVLFNQKKIEDLSHDSPHFHHTIEMIARKL